MKQSNLIFTVLLVPLDFISVILAGIGAYALRTSDLVANVRPVLFYLNLPFEKFLGITLAIAVFLILVFALVTAYFPAKQAADLRPADAFRHLD